MPPPRAHTNICRPRPVRASTDRGPPDTRKIVRQSRSSARTPRGESGKTHRSRDRPVASRRAATPTSRTRGSAPSCRCRAHARSSLVRSLRARTCVAPDRPRRSARRRPPRYPRHPQNATRTLRANSAAAAYPGSGTGSVARRRDARRCCTPHRSRRSARCARSAAVTSPRVRWRNRRSTHCR